MIDAKLIDNKPYCSKCGSELGRVKIVRNVIYKENKYPQFIKICTKCNEVNQYCGDYNMNSKKRYVFSQEELKQEQE